MYEESWQVRGYEEFLMDLAERPEWCEFILDQFTRRNLRVATAAARSGVDLIITGDSFGMHVAIALKKYVIVWFGVSCPQEIDLLDRGVKLIPEGLECAPCWKKECPYGLECIQMIDLERIVEEVKKYQSRVRK